MNTYEAMFIFPDSIKDSDLEEVLGRVKGEIKKLEGEATSTTRLGKRAFARRMKKQEAGHYVVITFKIDGQHIRPLLAKYRLNEEILRVQIIKAPEGAGAPAGAVKSEEV